MELTTVQIHFGLTIYTTRLTGALLLQLAPKIAHTAYMFQQEIAKAFELRVNIFGRHVFATALYSQRSERTHIDWRRRYDELEYGVYSCSFYRTGAGKPL